MPSENRSVAVRGPNLAFVVSIAVSLCLPATLWASGQWTWVGGSNLPGAAPVYGTLGVPGTGNDPGARSAATTWSDASGNLWLFGGGVAQGPALVNANDLWRYTPADQTWTWVSGSQPGNTNGVYGTRGTPAATNVPGARRGAAKWIDDQGRLWLFGGDGMSETSAGLLSDLWMFDPATKNWTWVAGSKSENRFGAYGDKGKTSPKSEPGSRIAASTWVDNQGQFWLFGGEGCSVNSCDSLTLNDLWRFDPASRLWTWMSGSDRFDSPGNAGTRGVPDRKNEPSSRAFSGAWTDCGGKLFLFGGEEVSRGTTGARVGAELGDLWMYDPSILMWTWADGNADGVANSTTATNPPSYGTLDVSATTNVPGAHSRMLVWTDANREGWLFGGEGIDAGRGHGFMNDLWTTTGAPQTWVWRNGSQTAGANAVYGTQGVPASTNNPGPRLDAAAWTDATTGTFWLYGGEVNNGPVRNDLWKFSTGSTSTVQCPGNFTAVVSVLPIYMQILFGITNDGGGVGIVPGKGLVKVPPRDPGGPIVLTLQQQLPSLINQAAVYSEAQSKVERRDSGSVAERRAALRRAIEAVRKMEVSLKDALMKEQAGKGQKATSD